MPVPELLPSSAPLELTAAVVRPLVLVVRQGLTAPRRAKPALLPVWLVLRDPIVQILDLRQLLVPKVHLVRVDRHPVPSVRKVATKTEQANLLVSVVLEAPTAALWEPPPA